MIFLEMQSEIDPWFMVCQVCVLFTQQPLDSDDMLGEGSEADWP